MLTDLLIAPSDYLNFVPVLLLGETSFLSSLGGNLLNIAQVALGLGFVIFVHELGHFLAAKTFGVRCDKFYVGFDVPMSIGPIKLPSTLGKFTWGETEYGIGIIPLGGYVKMLGQNDDPRAAEEEAARTKWGDGDGDGDELNPRSYTAKPVWQRMIIISAGVVMNLIFAVILAGVAYWSGAPFTPTLVGDTYAGGPAWESGLQVGDKIVRYGEMEENEPNIFFDDFRMDTLMRGLDRNLELPLTVIRDGKEVDLSVEMTNRFTPREDLYTLGWIAAQEAVIGVGKPPLGSLLAEKEIEFVAGDEIIKVGDQEVEKYAGYDARSASSLEKLLQAKYREPVEITVNRESKGSAGSESNSGEQKITLPAVPLQTLGLGFEVGPVVSIQPDSVAAKAGFKVGDQLLSLNGEKIVDGLTLPNKVGQLAGATVEIAVQRGPSQETLTFDLPADPSFGTIPLLSGDMPLGRLGMTYEVRPIVSSISDSLTKANEDGNAEQQVQVGDKLVQVQWSVTEEFKSQFIERYGRGARSSFKEEEVDKQNTIPSLFLTLQNRIAGSDMICTFERDGKVVKQPLTITRSDEYFWHERGLVLRSLGETRVANGIVDACGLGLYETKRRFVDVLNFLRLLVTGKVGFSGLGGPIEIAQVASAAASEGVSKLMLFLTFLSANLAIVNFLPIPALDGGHMMFLTAEAIRGKPISENLQAQLTMVGVLCLLCLMAFVIIKGVVGLI